MMDVHQLGVAVTHRPVGHHRNDLRLHVLDALLVGMFKNRPQFFIGVHTPKSLVNNFGDSVSSAKRFK